MKHRFKDIVVRISSQSPQNKILALLCVRSCVPVLVACPRKTVFSDILGRRLLSRHIGSTWESKPEDSLPLLFIFLASATFDYSGSLEAAFFFSFLLFFNVTFILSLPVYTDGPNSMFLDTMMH